MKRAGKKHPFISLIVFCAALICAGIIIMLATPVQVGLGEAAAMEVSKDYGGVFGLSPFVFADTPGITLKTLSEETDEYYINVFYPETESLPVTQSIANFVNNEVSAFKSRIAGGFLEIRFESHFYNEYIVSLVFDIYKFSTTTGPVTDRKTYVYDLMGACELELRQLFTRDFDFLPSLSQNASKALREAGHAARYGEEAISGVSAPVYENFQRFAFDDESLYLFFSVDKTDPEGILEAILPVSLFGESWNVGLYFDDYFSMVGDETEVVSAEDSLFPIDALAPPPTEDEEASAGGPLEPPGEVTTVLDNKKYVALTFDDGPQRQNTTRLLDGLKEYGAKATFFILGHRISSMTDIIERMHNEGHSIGCHTYNHKILTGLSKAQIIYQLDETNRLITEITDEDVLLLRPPYGAKNSTVVSVAKEKNMSIITWDVDPRDWKYMDAEAIAEHIIGRAQDGDIILLHDIYPTSVDAALIVVEKLSEEGFVFVTVDELINMHSGLEAGSVYRNGRGPSK